MVNIQSKIKGALYGFAIGDAMGATTEFMDKSTIKAIYGEVKNIIGGGWLNLKPGDVTDDTQMMLCVCDAIGHAHYSVFDDNEKFLIVDTFLNKCCENFVDWYLTNPPDIGNCCLRVISTFARHQPQDYKRWIEQASNPESLGNGSLMRTLPIILSGHDWVAALLQSRLTHNNVLCDNAVGIYYRNVESLLFDNKFRNVSNDLAQPTGHVLWTLNNAMYWVQNTNTFEESIIKAVNHGGDADTIAAITGSMAGALYGFEAIPKRWVNKLNPEVKKELNKYAKLFEKINKKVCTNFN
jgi:ADP-ribosyl-[dinitrogen reductase] hydrolase